MSGVAIGLLTQSASKAFHRGAIATVTRAPMNIFSSRMDYERFSRGVGTIDEAVSDSIRTSNVIGAFALIAIIDPWFLTAVAVVMTVYHPLSASYRANAREIKRLDAILRSSMYAHSSESPTCPATIRAYGEVDWFRKESKDRVNIENRFVCTFAGSCEDTDPPIQDLLADDRESTLAGCANRSSRPHSHSCRLQ